MVGSETYQDILPPQQLSGPMTATLKQDYSEAIPTTGPHPSASGGNQHQWLVKLKSFVPAFDTKCVTYIKININPRNENRF